MTVFAFRRDGVDDVEAVERRRLVSRASGDRILVLAQAQDCVQVDQLLRDGERVLVVEVPGCDEMHSLIKRASTDNSKSSMRYWEQAIESMQYLQWILHYAAGTRH